VSVDLAAVEALRDLDYTDAEICAELGVDSLNGHADPPPRVVKTVTGVPRHVVFAGREAAPSILPVVDEFRDDEEALAAMLAGDMPRSGTESCVPFGTHRISRAGLARRVAQQMAEGALGVEWWQVPVEARMKYARLAGQFVTALEAVAERGVGSQGREHSL
jgi:hypothetical protein